MAADAREASAAPPEGMIQVRLASGLVEGRPLWWSEQQVRLLGRDGQLISFRTADAQEFSQSAPRFASFSYSELRARLHAEFGGSYDVTGTGHYLVVHPRGGRDQWAERFEQLYRAFIHYFEVRGLRLREPPYPLIAVVFPNQAAYARYAASIGEPVRPDYLGHYSPTTNRIYLFDSTEGGATGDWTQNAATIIHEATHQTAFNTGIHRRFNGVPRWAAEGLAMLFEAPGVWRGNSNSTQRDRLLPDRLADFRDYLERRPADALIDMLRSDAPFNSDPRGAYAQAWALSFYLSETQPRQYSEYLARTAERSDFERYTPQQRLADFTDVFGSDSQMLDARFLRYMARLR